MRGRYEPVKQEESFYPKLAVKSFRVTVHQNSKYISGLQTPENTADPWYQQVPPECERLPPVILSLRERGTTEPFREPKQGK